MFARRTAWELRPNRLAIALQRQTANGREVLDLTVSNPTESDLQYDAAAILAALANRQSLQYQPDPKGLLSARMAVADYYRAVVGCGNDADAPPVHPDRVLLTTSTSEAYSYVFCLLCDPGDELLAPTPSYPLFEFLAGLEDVKLTSYPLFYDHGWHIDLHRVMKAITPRTRAVILVNPNNPTGSYVKPAEAAELNALCASRKLALVVDEVFLDYALEPGGFSTDSSAGAEAPKLLGGLSTGVKPSASTGINHGGCSHIRQNKADVGHHAARSSAGLPQFGSFAINREALTFTLSGISKISALPQMKLAWMVVSGPAELAQPALARLEVIADTYLSMNAPIQLAAPVLLAQREAIQRQLMRRMRANLQELDRQLAHHGAICTRLVVEGGWYAVLRVPVTRSDEELALALLEQANVLVQPGYFYEFSGEGYLVVSLITPEPRFREGVRRAVEFVIGNL